MDRSLKDPATAPSRIYIGNLGENVSKTDLENIFRKYGNIRGSLLSRNFGFVQFDSEESANNAIANENEQKHFNRTIIVRNAMKGNNNSDKNNAGPNNQAPNNPNSGGPKNFGGSNTKPPQNQDNNMRGGRQQWRNNNNRNIRNADNNMNSQNGRDRSPLDGGC